MKPETLRKLSALGLNVEQIAGVMEIMAEDAEEGKEKARERWRRWKAKQPANVGKRLQTDANVSKQLAHVEDISSKIEITGKNEDKKEIAAKPRGGVDEFKAELSSILDPDRIEAVVAVRRKKGATFSAHAGRLLVKALRACPNADEAADEMVLRNWTGIKPEWLESRGGHRSGAPPPPARVTHGVVAAYGRMVERQQNGTVAENGRGSADAERIPADDGRLRLVAGHIRAAARSGFD